MSRSGTSRATQHGWSSLAASGAANWVAKNCRLSLTRVWLFWRRSSHYLPEAHHVDPNVSTAIQVCALLHDFTDSKARDSELWDLGGVPPFHKWIDPSNVLLVFVHRVGLGEGAKILTKNHRVLDRRECEKFQTLARVQTHEQREFSGIFRLTVLWHSPLDVDAHSSRDARCTLRCRGAKPGQLVTHLAREIIQSKVVEQVEKRPPQVAFTQH